MTRDIRYSHDNLHSSHDFRRKKPNYILWFIVAIVLILVIFYILKNPPSKETNNNSDSISALKVVENPEKYLGMNLSLKDVDIIPAGSYPSGTLIAYEKDGTVTSLPYSYPNPLSGDYQYNFYGTILKDSESQKYWFQVDRAVQKDKIVRENNTFFSDIKTKISNFFSGITISKPSNDNLSSPSSNKVRVLPSIYYVTSCAETESIGEMRGISDYKSKVCRQACGKENMDYSSNACEKDALVCYCL